jgi:hypothetical protein
LLLPALKHPEISFRVRVMTEFSRRRTAIEWLVILIFALPSPLLADSSRTALQGPPKLVGREVREFVLVAPVIVGEKLPPGLPTTIRYEMRANRFVAVCEDREGIFYQAVGPFQNVVSTSSMGGLYVTKSAPVQFYPYTGNARHLRMRVSLQAALGAADLRKIHYVRANEKK